MRLAIIGDIHGNLPALRAALADAAGIGVNAVYCVGDVVGRGPHPDETVRALQDARIPTVQGNWDEAVGMGREQSAAIWPTNALEVAGHESLTWSSDRVSDESRAWLRGLPTTLRVELGAGRSMLLFHGSPMRSSESLWSDRPSRVLARIAGDDDAVLFAFGHTHEAWHRLVAGSHFVAVGSVGCGVSDDHRAWYAVVYVGRADMAVGFRAVDYDHAHVERDMTAAGLSLDLLAVPPARHSAPVGEALVSG